jgi:primary-amine oxidase
MTMESAMERTSTTGDGVEYPLDPLSGAEIEAAAPIVAESEFS